MTKIRAILSKFCCCLLLTSQFCALAQEASPQEPPKFTINIVRGNDAQNNLKKGRATSEVVVEVRDRNDKPIGGAIVTFTLPRGTGGVFPNGSQTAVLNTNANGQVAATFKPQGVGRFDIDVSVNSQGQTLSTKVTQSNLAAAAGAGIGLGTALVIGAAAAAAVAVILVKTIGGDKKTNVSLGSPRIP